MGSALAPVERSASHLLMTSIQVAANGGLALWQIFILVALAASSAHPSHLLLSGVHLGILLLCIWFVIRRSHSLPMLIVNYFGVVANYAATNTLTDALAFAAMWTTIITCATPALVLRARSALIVTTLSLSVLTFSQILLHPHWPAEMRIITVAGAVILFLGGSAIGRAMHRAARAADAQTEEMYRAIQLENAVAETGRALAEDTRIIHDTAINTLGAVAQMRFPRGDPQQLKDRCARDAHILTHRASLRSAESLAALPRLITSHTGAKVEFAGPDGADLDRIDSLLEERVSTAIVRACLEIAMNSVKHTGRTCVGLTVELVEDMLLLTMSDEGPGFSEEFPRGGGLDQSVFQLCAEVGVDVALRSTPATGTTITLKCTIVTAGLSQAESAPSTPSGLGVSDILRTGCWAWVTTIVLADLALSILRPTEILLPALLTTAAVGVLVLLAWWTGREADEIPRWLTGLLIASVPGVYAISFLVTMAAGVGIIYLPGALLTAPLPILLVMRRSRAPVTAAIGALIVSIAVLSLPLIPGSSGIDPLPIVAAIPQLALFGCWVLFIPAMRNIGEIYDRERRRALAAAVQSASQAAVTEARARWVAAGAGSAAELLHNIATGAVDPYDERVQARCAAKEQYLRQLLSFDANLVHLSPWLALALANARARGVNLEIRGGSIDAANGPSARLVGRVLLAVIQSTEEGEGLRLSLLTQAGQPTCMLLGPGRIADQISLALADHDSHLRISAVGERALIETTPVPT